MGEGAGEGGSRGGLWRAFGEGTLLLAFAAALGFGLNAARKEPLPLRGDARLLALDVDLSVISAPEASKAFDVGGHVFLDARDADAFRAGHIGGAFSVPPEEFLDRYAAIGTLLSGDTKTVVYGAAEEPSRVEKVAKALLGAGVPHVSLLLDGYEGWVATGAPTETGDDPTIAPSGEPANGGGEDDSS